MILGAAREGAQPDQVNKTNEHTYNIYTDIIIILIIITLIIVLITIKVNMRTTIQR